MSEFYKNLKKIRKEKGISLEDINKRTKINISILNAIENGEFSETDFEACFKEFDSHPASFLL